MRFVTKLTELSGNGMEVLQNSEDLSGRDMRFVTKLTELIG